MRALAVLFILGGAAAAQPGVYLPTHKEALGMDMVAKIKFRWSRVVDGKRVNVTIHGGEAERLEPWLSDKPSRLTYDLNKNRALEKALKSSNLPKPMRAISEVSTDRSLELLADGPKDWEVIARWSMPDKTWAKKFPVLYDLLEPMFKMQVDTFNTMPGPPK